MIDSGTLNLKVTLRPEGSSSLKGPITFSFGGPFESRGKGKVPDSDFTIKGDAEGRSFSLRLISAAGHGYVESGGDYYRLPAAEYARVESSFGSTAGAHTRGTTSLSKLGIDPYGWLRNPQIAGTGVVDGTPATRINAGLNVTAMTAAFAKVLANAKSLGLDTAGKLPGKLSDSELEQISSLLGAPRLSVWSATGDHALRSFQIDDTLTIPGAISSVIDGLSKLGVEISFSYGDVNRPQTITAPPASALKPYSQFQAKARALESALEYVAIEGASGAGSSSGSSTADSKYSRCVTRAAGNVAKLQKCQSLL